jgi:hypothetical protein
MSVQNDREDILRKVRGLIAKADGTDNAHEADAFRAKADAMMAKYTINHFELEAGRKTAGREPETRFVDISFYFTHEYGAGLFNMMSQIYRHCRCRIVTYHEKAYRYEYDRETRRQISLLAACGLPVDLDYADMLFTSLMLDYSQGMEPKPMPGEEMIKYLVRAKEAGMKWERIAELMLDHPDMPGLFFEEYQRNVGVKFTKLYTDYCRDNDRPRLRVAPSVYQRSFSMGYFERMRERLNEIKRKTREAYDADLNGTDVDRAFAVVLADIDTVVEAYVKRVFPLPEPANVSSSRQGRVARPKQVRVDYAAMEDGRDRASRAKIGPQGEVTTTKRELDS